MDLLYFYAGQLNLTDFNATVDSTTDVEPVSVVYSWTQLDESGEVVMYTIETAFISNGSLIDTVSVLSANETTVENLPSCIEINATLTAMFISDGFTQTAVVEYATNETGEHVYKCITCSTPCAAVALLQTHQPSLVI